MKVDGTWYILDGSMAEAGGDKYYMVTHENYPREQLIADAEDEVKF